jgi:hypothetical protein
MGLEILEGFLGKNRKGHLLVGFLIWVFLFSFCSNHMLRIWGFEAFVG